MITFRTFKELLTIPIYLWLAFFRYLLVGGSYRKYRNSLLDTLVLVLVTRIAKISVPDYSRVLPLSGNAVINKMVPYAAKGLIKGLPGYGERYDKNSFWLVKNSLENKSNPIIIYLHGGGYFAQAVVPQIKGILAIYRLLDKSISEKTSVLHLDYELASSGYALPYQMLQLVETYGKLMKEGHTNIVLVGDSAGGNMILSFLQYLKTRKTNLLYPKNIVLISPWTNLLATKDQYKVNQSYYDNNSRDYLTYEFFSNRDNINDIIGSSSLDDIIVNPGKKPLNKADWKDIPTLNDENFNIFVIAGEDEVFRDDILDFANRVLDCPLKYRGDSHGKYDALIHSYIRNQNGKPHLRVFLEPYGVHDACLVMEHKISNLLPVKNVSEIDQEVFFGLPKIAEYFNSTL